MRHWWRYYAVATCIVVLLGSAVFARRLAVHGWRLTPQATGPPPGAQQGPNRGFVTTPEPYFRGQGGWVLSALPGCFDQRSSVEGPSALLAAKIPPANERIAPGKTIESGNCTLLVRANDVWVYRGGDRLRVPPDARIYAAHEGLTLVYVHAGRTSIRVYGESPER